MRRVHSWRAPSAAIRASRAARSRTRALTSTLIMARSRSLLRALVEAAQELGAARGGDVVVERRIEEVLLALVVVAEEGLERRLLLEQIEEACVDRRVVGLQPCGE